MSIRPSAGSIKRIKKELRTLERDPLEFAFVGPVDDDIFHWCAFLIGPDNTPYAGGRFELDIKLPNLYPFKPPKVVLLTKIYCPGFKECHNGALCCDAFSILQIHWSPAITIAKVLAEIYKAIKNCDVAVACCGFQCLQQLRRDRAGFERTAKEWTRKYAMGGTEGVLREKLFVEWSPSTNHFSKWNSKQDKILTVLLVGERLHRNRWGNASSPCLLPALPLELWQLIIQILSCFQKHLSAKSYNFQKMMDK
eukprot:m.279981 g.279981  ORF g.279981 m.279981 type:complete len:252 (-) comp16324_c1_seq2:214-969(-)